MATSLLETTVHPDWEGIAQRSAQQCRRYEVIAALALAVVTLALSLAILAFPAWPWHGLLRTILLTSVLWLFPLWFIFRSASSRAVAFSHMVAAALLLAAAAGIAYSVTPQRLATAPWYGFLPILLVPVITWGLLYALRLRYPIASRLFGLSARRWPTDLVLGVMAGLVLGLHLVITSSSLPGASSHPSPGLAVLVWALVFRAGFGALGEELFLRGMGYGLLPTSTPRDAMISTLKLALLSLLVFVIPILEARTESLTAVAMLLAYGAVLAVVAGFLRYRQQSVLPCIACNVVFSLFLVAFVMS